MQATVIGNVSGKVSVRVRRSSTPETLYRLHPDLKVGQRVEVKREVNNPFVVFVRVVV